MRWLKGSKEGGVNVSETTNATDLPEENKCNEPVISAKKEKTTYASAMLWETRNIFDMCRRRAKFSEQVTNTLQLPLLGLAPIP